MAEYQYSLGQKCVAEGVGMWMIIFLGEAVIANELLAQTHGHEMGWTWISFGFGMAFAIPIIAWSWLSAAFNPAFLVAQWVMGDINGVTFITLSGCEFLGAFLGAVFVWLHYLPHFKSIPEPAASTAAEALLRPRDAMGPSSLNIAGYNTGRQMKGNPLSSGPKRLYEDTLYYLKHDAYREMESKALQPSELSDAEGHVRRRSVQVADLHQRLNSLELQPSVDGQTDGQTHEAIDTQTDRQTSTEKGSAMGNDSEKARSQEGPPEGPAGAPEAPLEADAPGGNSKYTLTDRQRALYKAALIADQNAKLSVFATRPAIYSPVYNGLNEFISTLVLIAGALIMVTNGSMMYQSAAGLYGPIVGLYLGFFIFAIVICNGGATGVALNPARDLGPRLAHYLLPIPNKGPSEWYYGLVVPTIAPMVGGVAAGGLFLLVDKLNKSAVPATAPVVP